MKSSGKTKTFFSGVLILTAANLVTKVIGLIFKIPLTNMLGNEGMGYFNTAYQIYTWLYMLSTAGVPVALSMMIAERRASGKLAEERKLFRLTLSFFALIGLLGSALMMLFCKNIASFISADLSYLCILAIAPALFFVCVSSTVRGYFQGRRNMIPTAVSEVIEAALKLTIGISLGAYALKKGYPLHTVAAYSILGVTVGVFAGAVFLALSATFSKLLKKSEDEITLKQQDTCSNKALLSSFFKIAIPVMLSSSLLSMSSMLDTLIVMRRLQAIGMSEAASVALYGNYTAYCVTLFNLPPVLIYPIVNTLIPSLSAANTRNQKEKTSLLVQKTLKLSAIIALPCAIGLGALSLPILKLIFTDTANSEMAAPLLTVLAPSVFLIGIMAVTNAVLQSFKLQKYSVISMLCGAAAKAISAYLLPALKIGGEYLGIYASPISTFIFYLTITCMNFYFIVRHTSVKLFIARIFARPLIAAILCGIAAKGTHFLFTSFVGDSKLFALISISVAALAYAISLLLIGGITESDIKLIPHADTVVKKLPLVNRLIRRDV